MNEHEKHEIVATVRVGTSEKHFKDAEAADCYFALMLEVREPGDPAVRMTLHDNLSESDARREVAELAGGRPFAIERNEFNKGEPHGVDVSFLVYIQGNYTESRQGYHRGATWREAIDKLRAAWAKS